MNRLIKDRYIPLVSKPLGDNHKTVLMLTSEQGLIYAAAFGAAGKKGTLRSLIQPFSLCEGDLYLDPVKKLWRLKDGTCLSEPDFHSSLRKFYAATFWGELVMKTHGGAGSSDFFQLTADFFGKIDRIENREVPMVLIAALWTFLEQEGVRPDLDSCARCDRKAPKNKAVCYDSEGHVVCSQCRIGALPVLSAAGRRCLTERAGSPPLAAEDIENLFAYLLSILRSFTGVVFDRAGLDFITKN